MTHAVIYLIYQLIIEEELYKMKLMEPGRQELKKYNSWQ